jgi:hypothetical protein
MRIWTNRGLSNKIQHFLEIFSFPLLNSCRLFLSFYLSLLIDWKFRGAKAAYIYHLFKRCQLCALALFRYTSLKTGDESFIPADTPHGYTKYQTTDSGRINRVEDENLHAPGYPEPPGVQAFEAATALAV